MAWLPSARAGAEVYCGDELMPEYDSLIGKGDAMWRAPSVARDDLVAYADVEATAFEPHFVGGVLGPLLSFCRLRFAKAAYERPRSGVQDVAEAEVDEALAELMARPLLNLHYPELSGFLQPHSEEFSAPRELFLFHTLRHRSHTGDDHNDRTVAQGRTRCDGPKSISA